MGLLIYSEWRAAKTFFGGIRGEPPQVLLYTSYVRSYTEVHTVVRHVFHLRHLLLLVLLVLPKYRSIEGIDGWMIRAGRTKKRKEKHSLVKMSEKMEDLLLSSTCV